MPLETVANERIDSWKEIAAHLGRNERTVVRWEKERGLPVTEFPVGSGERFSLTGRNWTLGWPEPI